MKLARYNTMRDFDATTEPRGDERSRPSSGRSFVVQEHAARAHHYDFRLEHEGVLWSWAVPKGPSLDPADKRLAVRTEDHPVAYRDFEGTIPEGQYGGGDVIVWDRGTWRPRGDPDEGLRRGRLDFVLRGAKLRGAFLLVRTRIVRGKEQWLLMKRSDDLAARGGRAQVTTRHPRSVLTGRTIEELAAGTPAIAGSAERLERADLPPFATVKPQLATLVSEVPTHEDLFYEIKYDGYRALAWLDHGEVRIASRNGLEWTDRFGGVRDALAGLRARSALFDGEIAYVDEAGRTDFSKLAGGRTDRLVYFVFDLLHYDGADLSKQPLRARKAALRTILAGERPPLLFGDHFDGEGEAFFTEACRAGLEGIIVKRADRPYTSGRSRDWVKVKCESRQELVIVGFTPPRGERSGLGALLLAVHERDGFRYAGKVGTGFSRDDLTRLGAKLSRMKTDRPPLADPPRERGVQWVEPKLVCQVRFSEWTKDGRLRHPSFEGLREDKRPSQVTREVPREIAREVDVVVGRVKITHPDRVIDPESGATKADLARYHEAVSEHLLRYARKRPLMLLRCPERGIERGGCFVQKHAWRELRDVATSEIDGEEVLYARTLNDVFTLVQHNAIELHGWGSRLPRWDHPDWVVLDLDPDEGLPWRRVADAALEVRDLLEELALDAFVKTTGGKGLHVVVPLARRHGWDTVRLFAEGLARLLAARSPERYVATMSKTARRGKIFVDWLRNAKGATAILPYSPRARTGLPVAFPVAFDELGAVDPAELDIRSVPLRLAKRRRDPWAGLLAKKQTLSRGILDALEVNE